MELNKHCGLRIEVCGLVALIAACMLLIGATYDEIIADKNKQIDYYEKDISTIERDLQNIKSELQSFKMELDSLETSMLMLNNFLNDYKTQSYLSPEQIAVEANMVIFLSEDVDRLQENFKNKIVYLYKHGKNYELELLLSSKTPNEYLRRNEYLTRFAQQRKKELRNLESKKLLLDEKKKMLSLSISSQRFYVEAKRREQTELQSKLYSLNQKNQELKHDIETLEEKIKVRQNQTEQIKNFLANLETNKSDFKGNKLPRLNYSSSDFESLKGKLNLPVDMNLIKNEYGETINNATTTHSFNYGIDISIASGSRVFAVAEGIVTLIGDAPYYGAVVVITHGNNFRTVYASLSDVNVKTGDKIKLNQLIGRSGDSPEGQMLHFEIWKDKTSLNPREWVKF